MSTETTIKLLIDGNQGIHIPEQFWSNFDLEQWHITKDNYGQLADAYSESYWDDWAELLEKAYFVDDQGIRWTLHQDDDLFAVSEKHQWEEE